jgi:hypothetical protein
MTERGGRADGRTDSHVLLLSEVLTMEKSANHNSGNKIFYAILLYIFNPQSNNTKNYRNASFCIET